MNLFNDQLTSLTSQLTALLETLPLDQRVEALNSIREQLHQVSPFRAEPVDCVVWRKAETVSPNDYNPNTVAPPEMKLLEHSIRHDGYTQPVVGWEQPNHDIIVVDGFHRTRVGKESKPVRERVHGYIPTVRINQANDSENDRMASTIRHNRARGKHAVTKMTDIIRDQTLNGWSDEEIGKNMGMSTEEVLRLKQFNGLPELFRDQPLSTAWE